MSSLNTNYYNYSYSQFVGTYKPVPDHHEEERGITYKFVPGPFIELYVKAIRSGRAQHVEPYVLVIDEMNRGDAASIFGNLMRLLDRDRNGTGKYDVDVAVDLRYYLMNELGGMLEDYETIRLPDNMFIWATVNLSDQGAQVMDAAFKRRWHFEHIGIDDNDELLSGKFVILGENSCWKVEWNKLRKAINSFLMSQNVNEDKLIGPYFISEGIILPEAGEEINRDQFVNEFKDKVMMYLFEDAARGTRSLLFDCENVNSLSLLCRKFDRSGIEVFNKDIQKKAEAELISYALYERGKTDQ
jgi:5-methylcytosine-specific restriction endonuclease McrBC GTP-binding regulatory subunit McrB